MCHPTRPLTLSFQKAPTSRCNMMKMNDKGNIANDENNVRLLYLFQRQHWHGRGLPGEETLQRGSKEDPLMQTVQTVPQSQHEM